MTLFLSAGLQAATGHIAVPPPLADEAAWLVSVLPWQRVTSTSVLAQCQADARASGVIRFWSLVAAKQGRPEPPRTAASLFFPLPPQYGQYLT